MFCFVVSCSNEHFEEMDHCDGVVFLLLRVYNMKIILRPNIVVNFYYNYLFA